MAAGAGDAATGDAGAAIDGATMAMTKASAPTMATAAAAGPIGEVGRDVAAGAEQTLDAQRDMFARRKHARCGNRRTRPARGFRHLRKTERVGAHRTRERENPIVAGDLALEIELLADKARGGIPCKQSEKHALQSVRPVVAATQMGELVQADLIDFGLRKLIEQHARDQNHRVEQADCNRNVGIVADAQAHVARTLVGRGPARHRVPVFHRQRQRVALERLEFSDADCQAKQSQRGEDRPCRGDADYDR